MKYLLQENEMLALKQFIPERMFLMPTSFGTFINRYQFEKMIENNMVARIVESTGVDFETWLESKKVYKYKIYKMLSSGKDAYMPPIDIDFTTGLASKLAKKTLPKVAGVPTSVEYYEKKFQVGIDPIGDPIYEYENLVLRIDFELTYSDIGFITERDPVIKWYYDNDTLSKNTKSLGITYSMAEDFDKITEEGILRRGNIIADLQYPLLKMLTSIFPDSELGGILIIGRSFLDEQDDLFKGFIERALTITDTSSTDFGKKVAYVTIRDYNGEHASWLDINVEGITPRVFLTNALDY